MPQKARDTRRPSSSDEMMDTDEVAAYLRLKRRKIYELVRSKKIPCTRVTGKWLFPKQHIDRWLAENTEFAGNGPTEHRPAASIAGSHDPLLDWAIRESGCGLALLPGGSLNGLKRLVAGEPVIAAVHLLGDDGGYDLASVDGLSAGSDRVAIQWAWREQGLIVAPGNPLAIKNLEDVASKKSRLIRRQDDAGSHVLLTRLLAAAGLALDALKVLPAIAHTENDLGLAIVEGKADVGLAIRSVATQFRLGFVPLHRERFDLVMRRRDYFEPPMQKLLEFARTPGFAARAADLGGYDVAGAGRVAFNP
jgi:putative molybdopterin biosynthesis protein